MFYFSKILALFFEIKPVKLRIGNKKVYIRFLRY